MNSFIPSEFNSPNSAAMIVIYPIATTSSPEMTMITSLEKQVAQCYYQGLFNYNRSLETHLSNSAHTLLPTPNEKLHITLAKLNNLSIKQENQLMELLSNKLALLHPPTLTFSTSSGITAIKPCYTIWKSIENHDTHSLFSVQKEILNTALEIFPNSLDKEACQRTLKNNTPNYHLTLAVLNHSLQEGHENPIITHFYAEFPKKTFIDKCSAFNKQFNEAIHALRRSQKLPAHELKLNCTRISIIRINDLTLPKDQIKYFESSYFLLGQALLSRPLIAPTSKLKTNHQGSMEVHLETKLSAIHGIHICRFEFSLENGVPRISIYSNQSLQPLASFLHLPISNSSAKTSLYLTKESLNALGFTPIQISSLLNPSLWK